MASELEIELLFRELLDGLPQGHLLRRDTGSDPYYEIKRLKPLLETMNREGWSEALLAEKLDRWVSNCADKIYGSIFGSERVTALTKEKRKFLMLP